MIDKRSWQAAYVNIRLLAEGRRFLTPEKAPELNALLEKFYEDTVPYLQDMLRNDLQTTPPDDRDETWRQQWKAATEPR